MRHLEMSKNTAPGEATMRGSFELPNILESAASQVSTRWVHRVAFASTLTVLLSKFCDKFLEESIAADVEWASALKLRFTVFPCHRLNSKWTQRCFRGEHAVRWCVSLPGDFISPSQGCHNFRPNNQSRNMSSIVTVFSAAIPSTVFSFEWSITSVVVLTTTRA